MSELRNQPTPPDDPAYYEISDELFNEVIAEREHQLRRWGNEADDTKNSPNDFVAYIAHHSTRWFNGGFAPYNTAAVDSFRKQMVKVLTLAIAAIESIDRQRAAKGKTFYEG